MRGSWTTTDDLRRLSGPHNPYTPTMWDTIYNECTQNPDCYAIERQSNHPSSWWPRIGHYLYTWNVQKMQTRCNCNPRTSWRPTCCSMSQVSDGFTWRKYFKANTCYDCPSGKISPAGEIFCYTPQHCWPGTYDADSSNVWSVSDCISCGVGRYTSSTSQTACRSCEVGKYTPSPWQACISCAVGKYASSTAQSSCFICSSAKYVSLTGQSSCAACATGKFGSSVTDVGLHDEESDCISCAVGKYTSSTAQLSCRSCEVGKYASSTASTSCQSCGVGYYQRSKASASCQRCGVGFYQPSTAQTNCSVFRPMSTGSLQDAVKKWYRSDAINWSSMSLVNPVDSTRDYSSIKSPASTHSLSMFDSLHAWSAQSAVAAWMTIDLQYWGLRVSGVVTQGKNDADEWVTRYTCEYSSHASASGSNSAHWTPVDLGHVFHGNSDRGTKVASAFSAPVVAQKVKITVLAWHGWISMRAGVVVAPGEPMILNPPQGGAPLVDNMTTGSRRWSSIDSSTTVAYDATLDSPTSWVSKTNDVNRWMSMDLGAVHTVSGVVTQGRGDADQWVTHFTIYYSLCLTHTRRTTTRESAPTTSSTATATATQRSSRCFPSPSTRAGSGQRRGVAGRYFHARAACWLGK